MKKNIVCLSLACILLFSNINSVEARNLFVDNIIIPNSNVQVKDDRAFMALRPVAEAVGYKVEYNARTKTINVGNQFTHQIGTSYIWKSDGEIIDIGVPSYVFEGTTYVSTRLFSDGLGFEIEYDEKTKDIFIETNKKPNDTNSSEIIETYNDPYSDSLVSGLTQIMNTTDKKDKITLDSYKRNMSGILLDNATFRLSNSTVNKQGNTTSIDGSNFSGLNAVILVKNNSTLNADNVVINSLAIGGSGVFADNSDVKLSRVNINTFADYSKGVIVNADSKVTIQNSNITTSTQSYQSVAGGEEKPLPSKDSSALVVYKNGELAVNGGQFKTTANNILDLYGKTEFDNVTAEVINGNIVKSVGYTTFTTDDSNLVGDKTAFNISSLSNNDVANFTINKGFINVGRNNLFDINSANATINFKEAVFENGSTLIDFKNTSNDKKVLNLNLSSTNTKGDIIVDDYTYSKITIGANSTFTGAINTANANADVIVDVLESGTLYLTGETNVTVLNQSSKTFDNIYGNGYRLYYDETDKRNSWLDNNTYELKGGGKLIPKYYKNYLERVN